MFGDAPPLLTIGVVAETDVTPEGPELTDVTWPVPLTVTVAFVYVPGITGDRSCVIVTVPPPAVAEIGGTAKTEVSGTKLSIAGVTWVHVACPFTHPSTVFSLPKLHCFR